MKAPKTLGEFITLALGRMHLAGLKDFGRFPRDDAEKFELMVRTYADVWGSIPVRFVEPTAAHFCARGGEFPSAAEFARIGQAKYRESVPQLPREIQPVTEHQPMTEERRQWLRQRFGAVRQPRRMADGLPPIDDPAHEARVRAQAERMRQGLD